MSKKIISFFVLCLLLPSCFLITSCSIKQEKYTSHSFDYFDTVTTITGYADSKEEFDVVSKEILSELSQYHKLYDIYLRYDDTENLCTVNELVDGSHRTVEVDRRIIDLLLFSNEMYNVTGSMVNIAMGSVLSLWHDYRTIGVNSPSEAKLPPADKLLEASKHTDIASVVIDEENSTVTLADPNLSLDVGAVAKGYAVERIAKSLEEQGISGYVLNVGGNVRTIGTKPNGESWTVGIENPSDTEDGYIAYLELSGQALVTSGSYQRYYVVDGKRYHHIIHPDTLMPAEGYLSVSVVSDSSAYADALSTALFCMDIDNGKDIVENLSGVEAMWISQDGEMTCTDGWNAFVKQ